MGAEQVSRLVNGEALCRRAEKLLNTDKQVTLGVLNSLVLDDTYREYIKMCRHTPTYISYLLEKPSVLCQGSVQIQMPELEQAEKLLDEWESIFYNEDRKNEYNRKYKQFFPKKESAGCKSCKELIPGEFREVYLDSNASGMVRPEIVQWLAQFYGGEHSDANPSSDYVQGLYARDLIEKSRIQVADVLHTDSDNIIFTSSGSEANNLAIKGIAFAHLRNKGHLITSTVEHPSVMETMKYLETLGFDITWIKPDCEGTVSPQKIEKAIRSNTILVSVMAANNEVGTVNSMREIGQVCRRHKVPYMADGVQAFCKMDINPKEMGISLFTFSGHKIYGPKGAGGLYIESGIDLIPQIHGGGQEKGMRSSTENTAAIAALGQAAGMASRELEVEYKRLGELRDYFLKELKDWCDYVVVYGSMTHRIYNNLCLGFYGVDGQALKKSLNRAGICVSTGSACSTRKNGPSHVLTEIGADVEHYGMIRMGLGMETTKEQLDYVLKYLKKILPSLKKGKGNTK